MSDPRHSEQSTGIRSEPMQVRILSAKGTSHVCGTNDGVLPHSTLGTIPQEDGLGEPECSRATGSTPTRRQPTGTEIITPPLTWVLSGVAHP
jgi:hypothetical protein